MAALDERLDGVEALLHRRIADYHRCWPRIGDADRVLWLRCARAAASARLVAESWSWVAHHVPPGLLAEAATTATLHYDAERAYWRAQARDVATGDRYRLHRPMMED